MADCLPDVLFVSEPRDGESFNYTAKNCLEIFLMVSTEILYALHLFFAVNFSQQKLVFRYDYEQLLSTEHQVASCDEF
jgi:hypothetical protein